MNLKRTGLEVAFQSGKNNVSGGGVVCQCTSRRTLNTEPTSSNLPTKLNEGWRTGSPGTVNANCFPMHSSPPMGRMGSAIEHNTWCVLSALRSYITPVPPDKTRFFFSFPTEKERFVSRWNRQPKRSQHQKSQERKQQICLSGAYLLKWPESPCLVRLTLGHLQRRSPTAVWFQKSSAESQKPTHVWEPDHKKENSKTKGSIFTTFS